MNRKGWLAVMGIVVTAVAVVGCTSKRKEQQQADESSERQRIREAAVAGPLLFYPGDPEVLKAMIDDFLSKADSPRIENVRGLICPHAGYRYSGQTAAYGYKQLIGRNVRTVIVMAPSHYAEFRGASIPDVDAYRTPLGTIKLSPKAKELGKIRPFIINPPCLVQRPGWWRQSPKKAPPFGEDTPHTWEHSLEVQLPFLQRTLKDFRIVPIVFAPGKLVDEKEAARVLMDYIDNETILVASSDLSHFYPYETARRMDKSCTTAICNLDIEGFQREEACGKSPILTLMHIASKKGWKAKVLDYRNSGDTAGDKSGVVGYAAIAFFEPEKTESEEK